MNKREFIEALRKGLCGLPQDDIEERVTFYSEMIDDRMEEGFLEQEAVAQAGAVEDIVNQIVSETPIGKIAKERLKSKGRIKPWEIVLLALGSPIWLSIGIALFSVLISIYGAMWSVIISLWSVFAVFVGSAFGCIAGGTVFAFVHKPLIGLAVISAGFVLAGLSILTFMACKSVTKGSLILIKNVAMWIKNLCMKKEEA